MKIWTPWAHLEQENAALRKRLEIAEASILRRTTRDEVQRIAEAEIERRTGMDMYFTSVTKLATRDEYHSLFAQVVDLINEVRELRDTVEGN